MEDRLKTAALRSQSPISGSHTYRLGWETNVGWPKNGPVPSEAAPQTDEWSFGDLTHQEAFPNTKKPGRLVNRCPATPLLPSLAKALLAALRCGLSDQVSSLKEEWDGNGLRDGNPSGR